MRFALLLVLCAQLPPADGGKVKDALFRRIFGAEKKAEHNKKFDAEQAELMAWLNAAGFSKYATEEWLEKFDEDMAYDSVEDMAHLVADEDYEELGIAKEEAIRLQEGARKYLMKKFLDNVPLSEGATRGDYTKLLEPLFAAGYDEPDAIADIEMDEARDLGIEKAHYKPLVTFSEEYEIRELLQVIFETYEPVAGVENPFASATVWKPMIDVMAKYGVRSLSDVSNLSPMEGLSSENLAALKADPRVATHATKQEL